MKWHVEQINLYLQAKEYIDTALVPLIAVDWVDDPKEKAAMSEFILSITNEIESHFVGRIFQMPALTYIKDEGDMLLSRLRVWDDHFSQHAFKHVFYITSGNEWKSFEDELLKSFIWIPSLSLVDMPANHKKNLIMTQAQQTFSLITDRWKLSVKE